ncbi:MAG: winged helix-turn-helix domain-containing protein [Sporichthyaceae bacterium]|nr:winged helix-turn-helix domain-containing protein [Sporichthyaceae bacterium]
MEFKVLGPMEVSAGGPRLVLGTPKQRLVLAVLLCNAGQSVSVDHLIDAVWDQRPPRSALHNIYLHIHQLRRLLGAATIVGRGRSGYLLTVSPTDIDAGQFVNLAEIGSQALATGDVARASHQLHRALALWRGHPFADLDNPPALAVDIARLTEARLTALERRIDADLRLGRHMDLVSELTTLVAEQPYRERFQSQLMLALYRSGRRVEALAVYRAARAALSGELGLDPGADLRRLERAILAGEPDLDLAEPAPGERGHAPVPPVFTADRPDWLHEPAQLPVDIVDFTGRQAEVDQLDRVAAELDDRSAVALVAITGTAGVGKTALAVHWAHRAASRFRDGQLFVDLRGYGPGNPMRPIEALTQWLRALGVDPAKVPSELEPAAAMFRSELAGRQLLVELDNASSASQVRPLLPASSGCLTIVTSRDALTGLVARDGARRVRLGVLDAVDAISLLVQITGPARLSAEKQACRDLVRLCGNLPLAVRIAAAQLAEQPDRTVADQVDQLRTDRLGGLDIDGDETGSMRAVFDRSYAALPADRQRMFRLLGLASGPDITVPAAAALGRARPDRDRRVAEPADRGQPAGRAPAWPVHAARPTAQLRGRACDQSRARGAHRGTPAVARLLPAAHRRGGPAAVSADAPTGHGADRCRGRVRRPGCGSSLAGCRAVQSGSRLPELTSSRPATVRNRAGRRPARLPVPPPAGCRLGDDRRRGHAGDRCGRSSKPVGSAPCGRGPARGQGPARACSRALPPRREPG